MGACALAALDGALDNTVWHFVVVYLICSNLFSYFYYHTWQIEDALSISRQKRRYITFLLSVAYYITCYAYLFLYGYVTDIEWPAAGGADLVNAFFLSISNAFTLTCEGFKSKTQVARIVFASQFLNTFCFVTLILSASVPQRPTKT